MRKQRQLIATIAMAAAAAIFCSGCLAMMVPGLAYSGYKYEHDKNQPAASASSATEHADQQQDDRVAAAKDSR